MNEIANDKVFTWLIFLDNQWYPLLFPDGKQN